MAWWNPKTWGQPKETTKAVVIEPTKTAVRSIDVVTTDKAGTPTGGGYVTVTGKGAWSSGGGSGVTPARQVVDASFTSGGSASGEGGTITNTATNTGEVNKPNLPTQQSIQQKTYSSMNAYPEGINLQNKFIEDKPTWKEKIYGTFNVIGNYFNMGSGMATPTIFYGLGKTDISNVTATPYPYQSRGTITPDYGTETYGERYNKELLAVGGIGKPAEFVVQDIGKNLQEQYQSQVTTTTTQTELDELNKQLNIEYTTKATDYLSARGRATSFKPEVDISPELKIIGTTGAIVGGFAVAPVTTGALLGIYGAGESYKGYGEAFLGTDLTLGQRTLAGVRGTFGLVNFGIGSSVAFRSIERGIIQTQFEELSKSPIKFQEIQFQEGDKSLALFKAEQKYADLTRTFIGSGKIIRQGENMFILPEGKLITETSGSTWNILNKPSGTLVFGYEKGIFGTKGITSIRGEKIFSLSKTNYETLYSANALYGFETGKPIIMDIKLTGAKDISKTFGIDVSKKITPDIYGNERYFTFGTKLNLKKQLDVPIKYGITRVVEKPAWLDIGGGFETDLASGVKIFRGGGTKTPLSKTFGVVEQVSFTSSVVSNVPALSISDVSATTSMTNLKIAGGLTSATANIFKTKQTSTFKFSSPQVTQLKQDLTTTTIFPTQTGVWRTSQKYGVAPALAQPQATEQITKQVPALTFPISPVVSNPFSPINVDGGGIIIPPFPSFGFDMGTTTRKYKGKRKYKYTPSYESFALGIYGKAPKGLETGARIRPITKGFSFGGGTPTAFMRGFSNFGSRFKSSFNFGKRRRK